MNFNPLIQKFPTTFENYFNNKWPQSVIKYNYAGTGNKNIKETLGHSSNSMQFLANKFINLYDTEEKRVFAIYRYAVGNFKYVKDMTKHGRPEFWQKSKDTNVSKTGDCEDGSIWIQDMLALIGVPAWRRKLCAGWVQSSAVAPLGGHAYCIYLANDLNWYVLDWCYYPKTCTKAWLKVPQYKLPYYQKIWWTTNEDFSWAQHSTVMI